MPYSEINIEGLTNRFDFLFGTLDLLRHTRNEWTPLSQEPKSNFSGLSPRETALAYLELSKKAEKAIDHLHKTVFSEDWSSSGRIAPGPFLDSYNLLKFIGISPTTDSIPELQGAQRAFEYLVSGQEMQSGDEQFARRIVNTVSQNLFPSID